MVLVEVLASNSDTTFGRTPLGEWSARSRELHLTSHNINKGQTSMSLAGLEPAVPASDRPQTHALESAVNGTGILDS